MSRKPAPLLWIATAVCLSVLACGQPESDYPAPSAEAQADPTVVDAKHYTTDFENDRVRIVRIRYGAGEGSVMHYHPDGVAVFLTDYHVQMTLPDGSSSELAGKAGDHNFAPGGQHDPTNISDAPLEVVQIELKGGPSGSGIPDGQDASTVDAKHYTAEFENDQVRSVRIEYGAGEESVMHYHPDSVAVFLTDHRAQMTLPDGTSSEISAKAGEALFIPGGQHLPKNVSGKPWELVLVELK